MATAVIIIVIVLAIGTAAVMILSQQKTQKITTPIAEKIKDVQTEITAGTKQYHDPSGFSFNYPEDLLASPAANIKDQSVYSELTISSPEKKGGIEIQVLSNNVKNVDAWLTENKINSKEQTTKLKLADLDARQFEDKGTITTVAVDSGTLFLLTTDYQDDKNFWTDVNNKIIASFEFIQPTAASNASGGDSSSDDVILEGEEVVE